MKTKKNASRLLAWLLTLALLLSCIPVSAEEEHVGEATPGEAIASEPESAGHDEDISEADVAEEDESAISGPSEESVDQESDEQASASTECDHEWVNNGVDGWCEKCRTPCPHASWGTNGVYGHCEDCFMPCQHPSVTKWTERYDEEYVPLGEEGHIYRYEIRVSYTCRICGSWYFEGDPVPVEIQEEHTWQRNIIEIFASDATQHTIQYQDECSKCGFLRPADASQALTVTEEHRWQSIKGNKERQCEDCGYVCQHPLTHIEDDLGGWSFFHANDAYEPCNELFHWYSYDRSGKEICDVCNGMVSNPILGHALELEHHYFEEDSVCYYCGYEQQSECEHKVTIPEGIYSEEYLGVVRSDNTMHFIGYETLVGEYCLICQEFVGPMETKIIEYPTNHSYGWEGYGEPNICLNCGFDRGDCAHEQIITEGYTSGSYDYYYCTVESVTPQEDGHTVHISWEIQWDYCADCGDYVGDTYRHAGGPRDVFEPHTNPNGICYICGYDSASQPEVTPTAEPTAEPVSTPEPEATKEPQPEKTVEPDVTFMPDPTAQPATPEPTAEPTTAPEATAEPTAEPTTAPEPTTEPTATPEPTAAPTSAPSGSTGNSGSTGSGSSGGSSSNVSGNAGRADEDTVFVPTEEPQPEPTPAPREMVDTLFAAIEQAEENDATVEVEIVGAKEVLSQAEYAQLKRLPTREQILVTLSAIGMGDAVQSAAAALGVSLSAEAQQLTEEIAGRMAAASEEDAAALEQTLAEYFPIETVVIDGQSVEMFIIELEITVNDVTTVQRYGFRYDDVTQQWIFVSLDTVA